LLSYIAVLPVNFSQRFTIRSQNTGSTLLCAEQLGRVVYGCELEPVFCDLIVKRWENLTGKTAIYESIS
jgi:DNA modification methylase